MRTSAIALALVAVSSVSSAPVPILQGQNESVDAAHPTMLESRGAGNALAGAADAMKNLNYVNIKGATADMSHAQLMKLTEKNKQKKKNRLYWALGLTATGVGALTWYGHNTRKFNCLNATTPNPNCRPEWQTQFLDPSFQSPMQQGLPQQFPGQHMLPPQFAMKEVPTQPFVQQGVPTQPFVQQGVPGQPTAQQAMSQATMQQPSSTGAPASDTTSDKAAQ